MRRWRAEVVIGAALAAATMVSFAPAFDNGFVNYDDGEYVLQNPHVLSGLTSANARWALSATHASNWHPLTWWSLQLDRTLFGLRPWGFHLTNVLLHTANAVILFLVLSHMTGAVWRSALVAALFAVHPLHVESVAWVSERKDVLSTFFGLLSLAAYAGYAKSPKLGRYVLVVVSFVLSLLAKPMLVTLPCVLLLLDYWPLQRWRSDAPLKSLGSLALEKLPLFVLAAASCVATVWAQHRGGAVATLEEYSFSARLAGAVVAYVRYLLMAVWPFDLAAYYPQPRGGYPVWQVLVSATLFAAASLGAIIAVRRRPFVTVGWLWYVGTLVPVIGLVQVGEQAAADRYTYFPLIGIFLILAWAVPDAWAARASWRRVIAIATVGVLFILILLTREQLRIWHDSRALWNHALRVDPKNYFAHYNLGTLRREEGKLDAARRHLADAVAIYPEFVPARYHLGEVCLRLNQLSEAEEHLSFVVQRQPSAAQAHNQLGAAITRQGRVEDGMAHFGEALRLDPTDPDAHNNHGMAFGMKGKLEESAREFEEATRLNPDYAEAHNNLGVTLEQLERRPEALVSYREAVRLRPRMVKYRSQLAKALYDDGQIDAARSEYDQIARLEPGWLEQISRTAWSYATHPDPRMRNGATALLHAQMACQAVPTPRVESMDILAAAEAEAGQFDSAVSTTKSAVVRAKSAKQSEDLIHTLQERLRLYETRQPYRDLRGSGPVREVR